MDYWWFKLDAVLAHPPSSFPNKACRVRLHRTSDFARGLCILCRSGVLTDDRRTIGKNGYKI